MKEPAKKEPVILFTEEKNCSACRVCENACPKQAIHLNTNAQGFSYPQIDYDACISCRLCNRVCSFQKEEDHRKTPLEVYAASARDEKLKYASASGGIFAELARKFLEEGGLVAGSSMEKYGDVVSPRHILIDDVQDLYKLQGSKYVQSDVGDIYKKVRMELARGKKVLFSGTPCQVDGLLGYIPQKEQKNLLTVDIICHGVPSRNMFRDYLHQESAKENKPVVDFKFRDKEYGWGTTGSITFENPDGTTTKKKVPSHRSSYYHNFLEGNIYQEACYSCKYSGTKRTGDLTLGDFWGIGVEYPEYVKKDFNEEKGVSVILANTLKGIEALEGLNLERKPALLEKVTPHNGNLVRPTPLKPIRKELLDLYEKEGYAGIENQFQNSLGWKTMARDVWDSLPPSTKSLVKKGVKAWKK